MAEEFLHRSDVLPRLEQMGSERVPEGVAARRLGNFSGLDCFSDRALERLLADVMPADDPRPRVFTPVSSGKHPLPGPFLAGVRVLLRDSGGHGHADMS